MWNILTDVVLEEWFGIRLPLSKSPPSGSVCLPDTCRLLYCLDRKYARQLKADIDRHYLSLKRGAGSISIFAGHGWAIPHDLERERNGLVFLARQAEHFQSWDDFIFIIQST